MPSRRQLWTMIRRYDTWGISVNPFTLRFSDPSLEIGFGKRRYDRLVKSAARLSCVMAVGCALGSCSHWYRFGPPAEATTKMHMGIAIFGLCSGLVHTVLMRSPRIMGRMSPLGVEVYCAVVTVVMFASAAAFSPYTARRLLRQDPSDIPGPFSADFSDSRSLLMMQLIMMGSHFLLHIRWHIIFLTEWAPLLIYMALALTLGSPKGEDPMENLVVLGCTTMVLSLGKRALEYNERLLFVSLIQEQCLRCSSEFQLSQLQENTTAGLEEGRSTADSWPETTETGRAFDACTVDGDLGQGLLNKIQRVGQNEQWLISAAELTMDTHKVLGNGGFGTVMAGKYLGTAVAIKTPKSMPEGRKRNSHLLQLCNELRIMRRLRHPNIVTFFGAYLETETYSLALVLELVSGVTLQAFILNDGAKARGVPEDLQGGLCNAKRLRLLLDIVCALRYLHSRMPRVVHGDLKDSNIFVEPWRSTTHGLRAKLLDFGLARILTQHSRPLGGTLRWQAPEIIRSRIRPEASADIFSVGWLVYFTVTGRKPFHEMAQDQLMEKLVRVQQADLVQYWPEQDWLSARARPLVGECSRLEPKERPGVDQVHSKLAGWLKENKACAPPPPTGSSGHGSARRRAYLRRPPKSSALPTVLEDSQLSTSATASSSSPQPTRPGRWATPRESQKLLLSWALRGCHISVPPGCCCALHARVQTWTEWLQREMSTECADGLQEDMLSQCQACQCLLLEDPSQGSTTGTYHSCEICSGRPGLIWEEAATACSSRRTLAPTPAATQTLVLGEILLRTNLAVEPSVCCHRHAGLRNLCGLLAELQCSPCHALCTGDECPQQCTSCGLLLFNAGSDGPSPCALCGLPQESDSESVSSVARSTALAL